MEDLWTSLIITAAFAVLMVGFVGIFLTDSILFPCLLVGTLSSIATAALVFDLD